MASRTVACPSCERSFIRTVKQINVVVKRSGQWQCQTCVTTAKNIARARPYGYRRITNRGYVEIKTPSGFEREHVLVAEAKIGRALLPDEIAHHVNERKTDNSPSNIEVLTHGAHTALHNKLRHERKKTDGIR